MANYEFTAEENRDFTELATAMSATVLPVGLFALLQVGLGLWILATRQLEWGHTLPVLSIVVGLGAMTLAYAVRQGARNLRLVVETEGSDITHLMSGLKRFKTALYSGLMVAWLLVIGLFGGILERISSLQAGG